MADGPRLPKGGAAPDLPAAEGHLSAWENRVAAGRARTARLREIQRADEAENEDARHAIGELQITYEELSVAEDELRAQNEELTSAHELIESERVRYRELFQQAPFPYLVTDEIGTIRDANLAASRLVRVRADRLVGKPMVVFAQADCRRQIRKAINELRDGADRVELELEVVRRQGSPVPVSVTVSPGRRMNGTIREIRWLLVDLRPTRHRERTRRERAAKLEALVAARTAELQRAEQLKDRLIATVSHELRTPLTAIAGFTELLAMGLRGPVSDQQRVDIDRIHRAYEHMARVVDDLLSYNKVTGGRMRFDVEDATVHAQLQLVTELVAQHAAEKDVRLQLEPGTIDPLVHADPERLRQILLNLLGNAVKFTPAGGTVTVRSSVTNSDVVVEVQDTGPGIPEIEQARIFEPFVRLSRDHDVAGSGLGLAISREMALAMGGDISVTSEVGVGSCFQLRLPVSTRLADNHASG